MVQKYKNYKKIKIKKKIEAWYEICDSPRYATKTTNRLLVCVPW